jgi:hypothetical protein
MRRRVDQDTGRFGLRFSPSPHSNFITSLIYTNLDRSLKESIGEFDVFGQGKQKGIQGEAQYIFNGDTIDVISGVSAYLFDAHSLANFLSQDGRIVDEGVSDRNSTIEQYTYYLYNYLPIGKRARLTIAASYDHFDHQRRKIEEFSPKAGFEWNILPSLLFRVAAFQTVRPALVASQTIQPTQIAGFNQFYDDRNGTPSRLYGFGVDARIAEGLYTGAEISRRILDSPASSFPDRPFEVADQREDNYRGYLYMAISTNWALSMKIDANLFNSSNEAADPPLEVDTLSVPLSLLYFDERGFFGNLGVTYVNQDVVRRKRTMTASAAEGDENFAVVDVGFGYRLPQRRGLIGVEVRNILDHKLKFQDDSFREIGRNEPRGARYVPERTFLARATLNY